MADAELHVFARCGHWVQIERTDRFITLVEDFLDAGQTDRVLHAGASAGVDLRSAGHPRAAVR